MNARLIMSFVHVSLHLLAARHLLCSRLQPCCAYTLALLPTAIDPKLNTEIHEVWHYMFGHPGGASPEEMEQEKEKPAPPPTKSPFGFGAFAKDRGGGGPTASTATALAQAAAISAAVAHATAGAQQGAKAKPRPQKPRPAAPATKAKKLNSCVANADGLYECDKCLRAFEKPQGLSIHQARHCSGEAQQAPPSRTRKAKCEAGSEPEAGVKRARVQGNLSGMSGIAHGGSQRMNLSEMGYVVEDAVPWADDGYGGF